MESCDRTMEGFCRDLIHFGPLTTEKDHISVDTLVTELRDKEKEYLNKIAELEKALNKEMTENSMKLTKVHKKLESVEKEMMNREISLVDAEEKIRRHCENKLQQAKDENNANWENFQRELKKLTADIVELRSDLKFKDEQLCKVRKQMSSDAEVFHRKEENLVEELRHYVDKLRDRTELLSQICTDGSSSGEQMTKDSCRKLAGICDIVLQDLQMEKFLCAVCKAHRKNTLFLPCGHYSYCKECARSLQMSGCCPLCKMTITGFQIVYE
ncbi:baculoviral IAP repeat-containing protein 3-like [Liolophura sinensis]|uniref:baculoviral IAP repeat-containing protein 3-like n=1 Tax=Liolophura sinensis TaxID=3198878 RepID=UPI0031582A56